MYHSTLGLRVIKKKNKQVGAYRWGELFQVVLREPQVRQRLRQRVCVSERECVSVRESVCERECVSVRERESVCVRESE